MYQMDAYNFKVKHVNKFIIFQVSLIFLKKLKHKTTNKKKQINVNQILKNLTVIYN